MINPIPASIRQVDGNRPASQRYRTWTVTEDGQVEYLESLLTGTGRFADDRDVYSIDGLPVMDRFIRYERLHEDLQAVCGHLGVDFAPERLGNYKSGFNTRPEPFSAYYDAQSRERMETEFDWEIARFGYGLE